MRLTLFIFLYLSISTSDGLTQSPLPDREFRASWLTTAWGLDWPNPSHSENQQKQALRYILNRHVEQGLNAVIFQVVARGDALYNSETLPWAYVITGAPGVYPGWDPLAFAIEEAHKRGLELHAWFNVFAVAYNNDFDSPPGAGQPNLRYTKPEWVSSVMIDEDTEHLWLNPGIPDARSWQVQNVLEMVENYDVDAVHFDRIRYFSGGYSNDPELFEQHNPEDISDINDWRRYNVTEFLREASEQIRELKPWVKIGAAVSGHYNRDSSNGWPARYGYSEVFADSRLWADLGYVDYLTPMNYWDISSPPRFDFITADWAAHSTGSYSVYMGTAPYKQSVFNEIHQQIDVTREQNIDGQVHFRYSHIEDIDDNYNGRYANISLIPSMAGKTQIKPTMIDNVTINIEADSLALKWAIPQQSDPALRNKFAIYCGSCGPGANRLRLSVTGSTNMKVPLSLWSDGDQAVIEVAALNRNYIESMPVIQSVAITKTEQTFNLARQVQLNQNYPNPFNPTTIISFDVPESGRVTLTVFDLTGRMVAELINETLPAGTHQVTFDGSRLSSGTYLYRLQTERKSITRKMTLLK